jgi:multiple sugar transport system substrate-binding protein
VRTTRRVALGVAGAALTGAVTAACGSGAGGGGAAAVPGAPKAVAGKASWLMRDQAIEVDWIKTTVVPGVAKVHPQLAVDAAFVPGAEYDAKLTALIVGGTPPDIWTHFGGRSYVDYLRNGWLADLTPLLARDKVDGAAFLPGLLDYFKNKGKQYALPYSQTYGSFVYYNKQLLAKAGVKAPPADWNDKSWTWDAMVDMAKKLTVDAGTPQATYGLWAFADGAQFLSPALARMWGGDVFLPEHYRDGIAQRTQLDSAPAIDGHQARQDLIYRQHVVPTPDDQKALGVTGDLFVAGKIAFSLQAGWAVRDYTNLIKDFEWGIAPIPAKRASSGPQFTDAWMLGKQAPNPEAGWALIRYLTGPEAQRDQARVTGIGPAVKAAEDEWFKKMSPRLAVDELKKVTAGALQHSFELPQHIFAKWAEILAVVREATGPVWQNRGTAADALRAAKPRLDQLVAQIYQEYQGTL